MEKFEIEVDSNGELPEAERMRRAEHAKRAYCCPDPRDVSRLWITAGTLTNLAQPAPGFVHLCCRPSRREFRSLSVSHP